MGELSGATAGLAYLRVLSADETVRARQADSVIAASLQDQARRLVAAGVTPSSTRPGAKSAPPRCAPGWRWPGTPRSLAATRQENLPSLALNGSYRESGRQDLAGTYNLQVLLSVPILGGFRRQNRAEEDQARLEMKEIRERDLGTQVETEARQAVLDLASARQQVAIAGERLRLAEQELARRSSVSRPAWPARWRPPMHRPRSRRRGTR